MEAMKTFFSLMTEQRNRKEHEVKSDLDAYFSKNPKGITCPVPGCPCTLTFLRWGALWDHFLDNNHKRDFLRHTSRSITVPSVTLQERDSSMVFVP